MPLFYIRHGQTDWNKSQAIQGQIEIPLNEIGLHEAQKAALSVKDIPFSVAVVSPLGRAMETAKIVLSGKDVPIIIEKRMLEESYGKMEGKPRSGEVYLKQREKLATRYPNGESYLDVAARIYPLLDELHDKYKDQNILLVGHGGISRVVNSYFFDMENDEFFHYSLDNCQIVRYEWNEKRKRF